MYRRGRKAVIIQVMEKTLSATDSPLEGQGNVPLRDKGGCNHFPNNNFISDTIMYKLLPLANLRPHCEKSITSM